MSGYEQEEYSDLKYQVAQMQKVIDRLEPLGTQMVEFQDRLECLEKDSLMFVRRVVQWPLV